MTVKRTKLIAELGNIHLHNIDGCKIAVRDAFNAGADLVKLQCINPLTAYWASKEQLDRYNRISWDRVVWHRFLEEMNKQYNNRVFVSVFDELFIDALSDVVPYWKVAYRMRENQQLIAKMIWSDKPIFFTTRSKYYPVDSERYFKVLGNKFIPLYGTRYDNPHDQLAGLIMRRLKVGAYRGVSINFGGDYAMNLCRAIAHVCDYIELHTKGDNADGPDCEWSLTMYQLDRLRQELI